MPSAPPAVSVQGVAKVYGGGTLALHGLSFEVDDGALVALLGPSGCGKSTALRLIAGLSEPSAGRIIWPGAGAPPGRGGLGVVFQEPTLMPWATAEDNAALPLRLMGARRAEARDRARAALGAVGLAGFERARPRELSGGMRMRVANARALVTEPRVLLLDEPFAALDEITRFRLNDDLLRLWAAHRLTVLFVTHSVFEAAFLAGRVLVMTPRPGRVFAEIGVAEPYPRAAGFRASARYAALCGAISEALRGAMTAAAGDLRAAAS